MRRLATGGVLEEVGDTSAEADAPLPAGVDPVAAASVPDNVLDGHRGVAPHLATRPGAEVVFAR